MSRSLRRLLGAIFVVVGIAVPIAIDAWETAHRLDISRDIGVAPWWALAAIGAALVVSSMSGKR